jgi:hypothetical protein
MKKIIFFILILSFGVKALGQEYIPMAVENAHWTIVFSDGDTYPPFDDDITFGYTVKGDTLINSVSYKKIYYNYLSSKSEIINRQIFGAIRDDIPNKKIYGMQFTSTFFNCNECNCDDERLLYDFTMEVGDSYNNQCLMIQVNTLTEITETELFGANRLIQGEYINPSSDNIVVIEGIGGGKGLFEGNTNIIGLEFQTLIDFCIGTDEECLGQFLLSADDYFTQNNIKLFYNKIDKELQLTNISDNLKLEIYSVLGKKVFFGSINTTIDVSQFQKGVYFYSLSKDNAIKKGKVLIY